MRFKIYFLLYFCFFCNSLFAQSTQLYLYKKYVDKTTYFQPEQFIVDPQYYDARHLEDSIFVEISAEKSLEQLIDMQLKNRVYGVEIKKYASTNLENCIKLLQQFPNLEYLKLSESFFSSPNEANYTLPAGITLLKQIKGIELYRTRQLDVADALRKFRLLGNLKLLNIQNVYNNTNLSLAELKGLRIVKCSSDQLLNSDAKGLKWEILDLSGHAPKRDLNELSLTRLRDLHHLKSLTLRYFNLPDLNPVWELKNLRGLKITALETAQGRDLFGHISKLSGLSDLTITFLKDTSQHIKPIANLKNLKSLSLWGIPSLKNHPGEVNYITGLSNLIYLSLNYNDLPSSGVNYSSLKHLKTLSLKNNKLTVFPSLSNSLSILDLGNNAIKFIPTDITGLAKLTYLNVSCNAIDSIPNAGWEKLNQLKQADFSLNHLKYFPGGLQKTSTLTKLNLSNNSISYLPDLEDRPYQLKQLNLSGNLLEQLPARIGQLSLLEELYVDGNNLAYLPVTLGNCSGLKVLDCHTQSYVQSYDANKNGNEKYITKKDGEKRANHIKQLPAGLANATKLEKLNLSGNQGIDQQSVFDVILSVPRPYFSVDVSGTGITALPASARWGKMTFSELNLNNNKLNTLPAEFASIPTFSGITLNNNPLRADPTICNRPIKTSGDMAILFGEIGTPLTNLNLTNTQYSIALAERLTDFYFKGNWQKAIQYANKAISIDSIAYKNTVKFDEIGVCRFKTNDYAGAIKDLKAFSAKEEKAFIHLRSSLNAGEYYLSQTYLAIHQPAEAAETHAYYARKHGSETGYLEAAMLYKSIGNNLKSKLLIDTALTFYQYKYENYKKYKYEDLNFVLNYAELIIIAGKPMEAINILNEQDKKIAEKEYLAIRNYLMATATYLSTPVVYAKIKADLRSNVESTGKISGWNYDMFNTWVNYSGKSVTERNNLLELENLVK